MLPTLISSPLDFLFIALSLVIAITIHEFAHAWAADRLGDPTPRLQQRLTLNPLAHLDPLGTLALLVAGFGWGKPVEFDPFNLANPKRDTALVALAGPLTNLLLAVGATLLGQYTPLGAVVPMQFFYSFILINVSLMIFNLLPIHPLDGGKILYGILPKTYAEEWERFQQQYGIWLILALLLPIANGNSPLSLLMRPLMSGALALLGAL